MAKRISLLFFVVIFLLTGCTQNQNSVDSNSDKSSLLSSIPTPAPGKAVAYGKVKLSQGEELKANIYLTENISAERPDLPATLTFSYNYDPRASQNEDGEFLFTDIEPGQYAIVFWNMEGMNVVPSDTSEGQFRLIDFAAGQSIDLGEINVP